MKLLVRVALLCVFAMPTSIAFGQEIPENLRLGADFIWHVAHADRPVDVLAFEGATLPRDRAFDAQVKAAHAALSRVREGLVPEVDVIKQYYLERGEQLTVFRVQSSRSGSRFFELHILGESKPPSIIGIKELDFGEVVEKLASRKMLSIRPRSENGNGGN